MTDTQRGKDTVGIVETIDLEFVCGVRANRTDLGGMEEIFGKPLE